MAFMPPLRALLAAYGDDGAALTAALGVEEVPYGELLLGVEAVNRARLVPPARLSDDDSARRRYSFHALPIA